jgi:spore germination protein KC
MPQKLLLAALLITGLLITPGCWNRKELNEIAVVMALGIDKSEEGYAVSAQVLNSGETGSNRGSSTGGLPVITYKSAGKTIPDALQRMHGMAPRALYLAHLRVLVFGEKLARQGIGDALDFIARDHQLRNDFFLLVAKDGNASEILEVVTPFEYVPASSLYSSILVSHDRWAATGKVTLQKFIIDLKRDGAEPVISGVRLKGKQRQESSVRNIQKINPETLLQHTGLGVFKKDRLMGWLEEPSSKAVNYVLNQVDSTAGFVECPGKGVVGFQVNQAASSTQVSLDQQGVPEFNVQVKVETNLSTIQCSLDLSKPSAITVIEQRIEDKFNANISKYIKMVQVQYGSDVFGFGEVLHRQYPEIWKKYRNNWGEIFKKMKIHVNAKVAVRRIGSIIQPIDQEMKEP